MLPWVASGGLAGVMRGGEARAVDLEMVLAEVLIGDGFLDLLLVLREVEDGESGCGAVGGSLEVAVVSFVARFSCSSVGEDGRDLVAGKTAFLKEEGVLGAWACCGVGGCCCCWARLAARDGDRGVGFVEGVVVVAILQEPRIE